MSSKDVCNDNGSDWNGSAHNTQISCRQQRFDKEATKARTPEQRAAKICPIFTLPLGRGLQSVENLKLQPA